MKLPATAYSAEAVASATKAGSYGVFGEGESSRSCRKGILCATILAVGASFPSMSNGGMQFLIEPPERAQL